MSDLIILLKLERGDTVGIICLSVGINLKVKHRIENASKCLKRMGYKVKLSPNMLYPQISYYFLEYGFLFTISIGVAQYRANETAKDFIKRVDAAMYRAKAADRNQVCRG